MLECSNKKHLKNATDNMQNSAYIWINNYSLPQLVILFQGKTMLFDKAHLTNHGNT